MAEAIGLAASIFTFVDMSAKIIAAINDIRDAGSAGVLHDIQAQLPLLNESLKSIRKDFISDKLDNSKREALRHAVEGCLRQAAVIHGLVCHILPGATDSRLQKTLAVLRRVKGDNGLSQAWGILETYKSTITLYLTRESYGILSTGSLPEPGSSFDIPRRNVFKFVGRENILALLKEKLDPTHTPSGQSSLVLYGMGGQGKTQIALEFYQRSMTIQVFHSIY